MKFARYTFLVAGIYGLLILLPHYLAFDIIGRDHPPAITHPEFFYGFVGLAVVFQIMFLVIASNPAKYRPMMLVGVLEKASFAIPCAILFFQNNIPMPFFLGGMIDALLGVLFLVSYIKVGSASAD